MLIFLLGPKVQQVIVHFQGTKEYVCRNDSYWKNIYSFFNSFSKIYTICLLIFKCKAIVGCKMQTPIYGGEVLMRSVIKSLYRAHLWACSRLILHVYVIARDTVRAPIPKFSKYGFNWCVLSDRSQHDMLNQQKSYLEDSVI